MLTAPNLVGKGSPNLAADTDLHGESWFPETKTLHQTAAAGFLHALGKGDSLIEQSTGSVSTGLGRHEGKWLAHLPPSSLP